MTGEDVAGRIEAFVRDRFSVAESDDRFDRQVDLFESGYIDSVGVVELIAFLESEFEISIPDEAMMSDDFMTIEGIARTVHSLDPT